MPEVLEDDPAEEAARLAQIEKVCNLIARRWMAIRTIASTWHHDQLDEIVARTKACIEDLLTVHGPEIPFAPDPEVPKVNGLVREGQSKNPSGQTSVRSETSTSSSCVDHHSARVSVSEDESWRVDVPTGHSFPDYCLVFWTEDSAATSSPLCMFVSSFRTSASDQVTSEKDAVDGYRNFMAMSEWYRLRTPFSQWFTKSMSAVFCPFADSLMMDPVGHVSLTRLF